MVLVHEFCLNQVHPHHTCENLGPLTVQILNFILLPWFLAYQAAFSIITCRSQEDIRPPSGRKSDLEHVKPKGWTRETSSGLWYPVGICPGSQTSPLHPMRILAFS